MFSTKTFKFCLLFLLIPVFIACTPAQSQATAEFPADLATDWYDLQLKMIKETPGFTPPVASRALGYSGITFYEAVVPGMPEHNSLVGQLHELTELPQPDESVVYHWPTAANSAMASILRNLYPTATEENRAAIDALEEKYTAQYKAEISEDVFNRSTAYGKSMAIAIFDWSKDDGGLTGYASNFPDSYVPPTGDGLWVSTPPQYQTALQPYWNTNRPFVLNTEEECLAPPPTAYSEELDSPFYAEALEVYTAVQELTPEEETIALFWADDPGITFTPPGHSISIASIVLRQENADLSMAAETYARVGIAVADAFIGCWHAKYTYNLVRPITYIQEIIDADWNTPDITDPVITPPFPEYTSGHSVQSGAAAAVMTALFGDNYQFTDDTHVDRGLAPRPFSSFDEAADEAAISRLYGGIHYRPAIELGVDQGKCIGEQVNALAWKQ